MGTASAGLDSAITVKDSASKFSSLSDAKSSGTGNNVGGANSVTFSMNNEILDATDFQDDAFARIKGLKDVEVTIDGNYDDSDTGQGVIEDDFLGNISDDLQVAFIPDEENGSVAWEATCIVQDFEITSSPDGKAEVSFTLVTSDGNGFGKLT